MPFLVRATRKTVSKMLWDSIGHAGTTSLSDVLCMTSSNGLLVAEVILVSAGLSNGFGPAANPLQIGDINW